MASWFASWFSEWFLATLAVVAGVSAFAELIGMAILDRIGKEAGTEGSNLLLPVLGAVGGLVTGLIGAVVTGTENGIVSLIAVFAVTAIGGTLAAFVGGALMKILGLLLKGLVAKGINDDAKDKPQFRPAPRTNFQNSAVRPAKPPVESDKHVIERSLRKKSARNRIAYISLFLALAEEIIKAFLQDTPILWAIITAVLLILSFLNQRALDYRSERDLYGASYPEAKETVTLIVRNRRTSVNISQKLVFTKAEINQCLQAKNSPNERLDKADKTSALLQKVFNTLLLYNPQKTGVGVLLGVVCHTAYENVMRLTDLGVRFSGLALPIHFWIALGVLALNFRNPFAYRKRTGLDVLLGVLLGVVLHTASENVMRLTDLGVAFSALTLPLYFWIAFGVLAFLFRNPFAGRSANRELEAGMRELKRAQKDGGYTESQKRQQWRNFISMANQKAS